VLAACAGLALVAPPVADAWTAVTWMRWHGARGADGVGSVDAARRVGRDAARCVALTAPLPWAGQAAAAALDVAGPLADDRKALAAALLSELRRELDPAAASSWRGFGLAAYAARAAVLAEEAARPAAGGGA
jgi:hypothetical protein